MKIVFTAEEVLATMIKHPLLENLLKENDLFFTAEVDTGVFDGCTVECRPKKPATDDAKSVKESVNPRLVNLG